MLRLPSVCTDCGAAACPGAAAACSGGAAAACSGGAAARLAGMIGDVEAISTPRTTGCPPDISAKRFWISDNCFRMAVFCASNCVMRSRRRSASSLALEFCAPADEMPPIIATTAKYTRRPDGLFVLFIEYFLAMLQASMTPRKALDRPGGSELDVWKLTKNPGRRLTTDVLESNSGEPGRAVWVTQIHEVPLLSHQAGSHVKRKK